MTISERLHEAMAIKTVFTVSAGGISIPVTETVVTMWVVMAICIVGALWWKSRLEKVPRGKQIFLEWAVDFCNGACRDYFGPYAGIFSAYIGTLFIFIAVMNVIPLFTLGPVFSFNAPFEIKPPTRDINVTAAFAVVSIVLVLVSSIAARGFKGWLKSFIDPTPIMLPFNILEYAVKPMSLALRLFGNMLGGFILMEMVRVAMPLLAPAVLSVYFDIFDGFLQALVFTFLTIIYLQMGMGLEKE
jgi:F-type H+-transporting ATPase subunit a